MTEARKIDPEIKRLLVEKHGQEEADRIERMSQYIASTDKGSMTVDEAIAALTGRKQ